MKEIEIILDYQEEALKLLLAQYKDSVKLQGLIDGKSKQIDDIELALFEIREGFYLDDAIGAQLDIIGKIWDVERKGLNDTEYRQSIYFKISLKVSGTLKEIISILKSFYGATYVEYHPQYPAKMLLLTDATASAEAIERFAPAGVKVIVKDKDDDTRPTFGFHSSDVNETLFAITHTYDFLIRHVD